MLTTTDPTITQTARDPLAEELATLPTLLTVKEAAEALRCSDRFVTSLCRRGMIRAGKIGNHWRINRDSLLEYVGAR